MFFARLSAFAGAAADHRVIAGGEDESFYVVEDRIPRVYPWGSIWGLAFTEALKGFIRDIKIGISLLHIV